MIIHFIGIGGIGVSGIASIYKQKGHQVQGSDAEESEITTQLKEQGILLFIGHDEGHINPNINLVVYSEAVPDDNPELKKARALGIKCLSGAEALAELSRDYFTIAVSGMHGKSTTSSMIAQILVKAGLDPTFVIGTKPGWRLGQGKYLVIEADDYKAKFLHYKPNILVLTNIEEEHMDFFSDLGHILEVFRQYAGQVKDYIVANRDDNHVVSVLEDKQLKAKSVFYSLKDHEVGDLKKILQVPGRHNVSNALAALNVARILKISDEVALGALSEYKGVWRRFECKKIVINGVEHEIVSDYAHHPTEITATLQAVRERFPGREVWLVFQPHQYQRTFYLFDDFTKALSEVRDGFGINKLIITDIYDVAGREDETIKDRINSQKLVANIGQNWAIYLPKDQLKGYLMENLPKDAVLIIMGAGDIYKLVDELSI
ncbi:MAG: UDP-N-acetylmuramate--L-alanine ligase [Candidatus Pacebacteria bacterium]|nr:UDP-N-acetylmuramate--L-alanine ligase [Candidatus Paceibacterota bacterium]